MFDSLNAVSSPFRTPRFVERNLVLKSAVLKLRVFDSSKVQLGCWQTLEKIRYELSDNFATLFRLPKDKYVILDQSARARILKVKLWIN